MFESYDRPYALKIKYPVTMGHQFLLDVVFCMLLYEGFGTLTESLLYEHSLDFFVWRFFLLYFFTFPSFHSVCCIIPIHFVDEAVIKGVAHGLC